MENTSVKHENQAPGKQKIGEILVKSGLINNSQLKQVLKRQTQVGGHLGSILIEMGFITIDDLIHCLSKKLGVPGVNLFDQDIKPELLNRVVRNIKETCTNVRLKVFAPLRSLSKHFVEINTRKP